MIYNNMRGIRTSLYTFCMYHTVWINSRSSFGERCCQHVTPQCFWFLRGQSDVKVNICSPLSEHTESILEQKPLKTFIPHRGAPRGQLSHRVSSYVTISTKKERERASTNMRSRLSFSSLLYLHFQLWKKNKLFTKMHKLRLLHRQDEGGGEKI